MNSDAGIVFLSPPAEFQMADEWYEYATPDHFWFLWRFEAIKRLLRGAKLGPRVLEIGCGNGAARAQLEQWCGCAIDGCDLNLTALRMAPPGCGGLFFYNIFQRRAEWREHFDSVVLLDTLEHIREPRPFLEAVAFHLKPGGLLLINVPALPSLYSRYDAVAGHVRRYRVPQLREELASAGFRIQRHAYWGLTMIPVLALRKLWFACFPPQRIIQSGFQPSWLADRVLRTLGAVERCCLPRAPLGTSLLALVHRAPEK